ncbi:unnamed protein product [Ectocarpus sp. CCAP 1310/34]|nr:unnamed protein product [Ectocarpus sp. CCAP 1310/34]
MSRIMSARSKLDACIKGLEDSLGAPAALEDSIGGVPSATGPATALQLVDSTIATLEASLGLPPGAVLPLADAKGIAGGNTKHPTKAKEGVNKGERKKASKAASTAGVSSADQPDGTKVDLRVGQITRVWTHETADKLYCEEIDVGEGAPRNIASGLVPHYSLEEMKGRKVIVMCNLKPRNLKGFKSQGMVVCAVGALSDGKELVELVVPPEGSAVGERLSFEGLVGGPFEPVSAAQMEKKKVLDIILPELTTDVEGTVRWRDHALVSSCGACTAPTVRDGAVR